MYVYQIHRLLLSIYIYIIYYFDDVLIFDVIPWFSAEIVSDPLINHGRSLVSRILGRRQRWQGLFCDGFLQRWHLCTVQGLEEVLWTNHGPIFWRDTLWIPSGYVKITMENHH